MLELNLLIMSLINIYVNTAAFFLYWTMRIICSTIRFDFLWKNRYDEAKQNGNVLFAVWHRATFAMFSLYKDRKACILVSSDTRGRILGNCASRMGYKVVHVPVSDSGFESARSLSKMVTLIKEGHDAVIAVDGPTGPLFEVKQGIFFLSSKLNIPIIPVGIKAARSLVLFWRWDKYFIPLPFSKLVVRIGIPILPGTGGKERLKDQLIQLS